MNSLKIDPFFHNAMKRACDLYEHVHEGVNINPCALIDPVNFTKNIV